MKISRVLFSSFFSATLAVALPLATICVVSLVPNTVFALQPGKIAPDFELLDYSGNAVKLSDYKGKVIVLEWFNAGCPFVKKHYDTKQMQSLQEKYTNKGVIWLTINSTNPDHKDFLDSEGAAEYSKEHGMKSSAFVPDPQGVVGKLFGAKTTPHMFIVDATGTLVYQGAIDNQPDPFGDPEDAENYVSEALEQLLSGKRVSIASNSSYGCGVKYAS